MIHDTDPPSPQKQQQPEWQKERGHDRLRWFPAARVRPRGPAQPGPAPTGRASRLGDCPSVPYLEGRRLFVRRRTFDHGARRQSLVHLIKLFHVIFHFYAGFFTFVPSRNPDSSSPTNFMDTSSVPNLSQALDNCLLNELKINIIKSQFYLELPSTDVPIIKPGAS